MMLSPNFSLKEMTQSQTALRLGFIYSLRQKKILLHYLNQNRTQDLASVSYTHLTLPTNREV